MRARILAYLCVLTGCATGTDAARRPLVSHTRAVMPYEHCLKMMDVFAAEQRADDVEIVAFSKDGRHQSMKSVGSVGLNFEFICEREPDTLTLNWYDDGGTLGADIASVAVDVSSPR